MHMVNAVEINGKKRPIFSIVLTILKIGTFKYIGVKNKYWRDNSTYEKISFC